jgi:acyl-CoA dehydrogenase
MDFSLSDEQHMIIKTTKDFVANELYPHEKEVEETGVLRPELRDELKAPIMPCIGPALAALLTS